MSLSFGWDPTPSSPLGLTARVAPSWGGQAQGAAEALWSNQMAYGMGSHQMYGSADRSSRSWEPAAGRAGPRPYRRRPNLTTARRRSYPRLGHPIPLDPPKAGLPAVRRPEAPASAALSQVLRPAAVAAPRPSTPRLEPAKSRFERCRRTVVPRPGTMAYHFGREPTRRCAPSRPRSSSRQVARHLVNDVIVESARLRRSGTELRIPAAGRRTVAGLERARQARHRCTHDTRPREGCAQHRP